jgi:sugar phosphate isomerase/epimerase
LLSISGPEIGLNIDTAWCYQTGRSNNPADWIKEWPTRIHGMHFKDFVYDAAGKWKDVVIGTGNLDLTGVVKTLSENNFAGFSVIEFEGNVENPVPELEQCVKVLRAIK